MNTIENPEGEPSFELLPEGAAQSIVGSFTSGVIVEGKGYKAKGVRHWQ